MAPEVLRVADLRDNALAALLERFGLVFELVGPDVAIPGSYWGGSEAGIVARTVYSRPDTPVHSVLHEASHTICMSRKRRERLHTDAGGDDFEEVAVCYLQVLLADELEGVGRNRLLGDMDSWGYTFRLGSAATWFREDAQDARDWLEARGLIDATDVPRFIVRV